MILPPSFYTRTDVVQIARELLGKALVTNVDGVRTAGLIVETEAYAGKTDKASHAHGRRTPRTDVMYREGGVAYVFLCYGIHHLFNVVTHSADTPHAILVRGIEPLEGIGTMLERRGMDKLKPALTAGPGTLSRALGITTRLTGALLQGPDIWIEDHGKTVDSKDIVAATRVGVAYAMDDALRPYRFYIKDNPYVSKGKGL